MDETQKWLANYERLRHSKQPNESWVSSKYDIQGMHWQELQQIFLPDLNMNFGQAISALKKSWKAYNIAGRNGMYRTDIAYRIRSIQNAMGIEKSEFPELEGMGDEDEELTDEEVQLKREEQENADDWGFEKPGESYTDEWSEEDKQLRREEQEDEDDWWFN